MLYFEVDVLVEVDVHLFDLHFRELFQCVLVLWVDLEHCRGA